jgi:hypothetical protein
LNVERPARRGETLKMHKKRQKVLKKHSGKTYSLPKRTDGRYEDQTGRHDTE